MEIRVLEYFLAIAEEENISKAAKRLHISQPSLSKQMKQLEERYGKVFFIRGNRQIKLTEDGLLLKKRAEEIISLVHKSEFELMSDTHNLSGNIYIGSGESKSMECIAKVIHEIQQQYPKIHFHIISGNSEYVSDALDKGIIDFGVFIEPVNLTSYESLTLPRSDTWGLLIQKQHPLSNQKTITSEVLKKLPLICSRQTMKDHRIAKLLNVADEELHIVATYNLLYNASLLVKEGVGCAVCLENLIENSEQSNIKFIPFHPPISAKVHFAWKKSATFTNSAKLFLQYMQNYIKKQSDS